MTTSRNTAPRARAGILGLEEEQIAGVLDQAGGVARRLGQIHDRVVGGQPRVGGEVDPRDDALVGAGVVAPADLDAGHLGPGRRGREDDDQARLGKPKHAQDSTPGLSIHGSTPAAAAAAESPPPPPELEPEELEPPLDDESLPPREKPWALTLPRLPLDPRAEPTLSPLLAVSAPRGTVRV